MQQNGAKHYQQIAKKTTHSAKSKQLLDQVAQDGVNELKQKEESKYAKV